MNKPKITPVSLKQLNQKLDKEAKRLVKEREDGIVKYLSKVANLDGDSTLVFETLQGAKVTLAFRLNKDGNVRCAYEARFLATQDGK